MKKASLFLFFALGFFSLLAQTLIIREFIISFGGNELGIGLFYFFWLFWVGIGSLLTVTVLGKFLHKHFLKILLLYPFIAFLQIFLFISLKSAAGVSWWEFFSFEKVFLYLSIFTSFISFFTGIIFTLGALWFKSFQKDLDASGTIAYAYVFEALGSFVAGCIATILISKLIPPFVILLFAAIIFSLASFTASIKFKDKMATVIHLAALVIFSILLVKPAILVDFSQQTRRLTLIPDGEFVDEVYTPYQHVFVASLPAQRVVFSNGSVLSSFPEVIDADTESALCVSEYGQPQRILVFGAGAENLITSLLKFSSVNQVVYCLYDRQYFDMISDSLPFEVKQAFSGNRLRVVFDSPRSFLKKNQNPFDLIIVYSPDPSNLVINSMFTKEFYSLAYNDLSPKGVFVTRITSGENYLGQEIRSFGSSVYYTLKSIFSKIVILPGKVSWFFAGGSLSEVTADPYLLEKRFENIRPFNFTFYPTGFRSLLPKDRVDFINQMYIKNPIFTNLDIINSDDQPLTFFLNLLVMARYSQSYLVKALKAIAFSGGFIFIFPVLIFFIFRFIFISRVENIAQKRHAFNAKLFQFCSGFLGFSFHLTLIFLFQNRFGTIFQLIGLVNALFMLGLCFGGFVGKNIAQRFDSHRSVIGVLFTQTILILSAYPVFIASNFSNAVYLPLFLSFFTISGVLTGSSYPLAARILEKSNVSLNKTAAYLELFDHWGGSGAGLIVGVIMLPLLGVQNTLIALSICTAIVILLFWAEFLAKNQLSKEKTADYLSFSYIRTSYLLFALAIIAIGISFFIQQRSSIWEEEASASSLAGLEGCTAQEEPFAALVCKKDGETEYVVETEDIAPQVKGFSDHINMRIRIDAKGNIDEIEVLKHFETPMYAGDLNVFVQQFKGRSINEGFSQDNIDTITGATISSKAAMKTVNETANAISKHLKAQQEERVFSKLSTAPPIVFDKLSWILIALTLIAIVLYLLPYNQFIRSAYLIIVVTVLGVINQTTFSLQHLAELITFDFGSMHLWSQVLIIVIPLGLGIIFGQFWCGWLCPFGALQELIGFRKTNLPISKSLDKKTRYFKYLFLFFVIIVISIKRDALLFQQEPLTAFFPSLFPLSPVIILGLIVLIFSIYFPRFWCRYFCPCGALLSLFNKIAAFKGKFPKRYDQCPYKVDNLKDIDCIECNVCLKKNERR